MGARRFRILAKSDLILPEAAANVQPAPCRLCDISRSSGQNDLEFQTFDNDYVERLRSGHEPTQAHFVAYFSELIRLKLRSRLQSSQAIEDVRQETFARSLMLLRSEGGIRHAERLGALVNSICNHVLSEQYRSAGRSEPLDDQPAELFVERSPDALTRVISDDTCRMVRKVLADLPPRDEAILKAVFLDERDKDDLCREFGVNRAYLRVLLHRAKQSFRDQYARPPGTRPAAR